jgi:hypothetical protein
VIKNHESTFDAAKVNGVHKKHLSEMDVSKQTSLKTSSGRILTDSMLRLDNSLYKTLNASTTFRIGYMT